MPHLLLTLILLAAVLSMTQNAPADAPPTDIPKVTGVAEDYDSAVELVEKHVPTVVVTDVRMPPTSTDEGIRLARWMRSAHPDVGVIVLSNYADPQYAVLICSDITLCHNHVKALWDCSPGSSYHFGSR